MEFLVVTNNYRASGGGDHLVDANVVYTGTEVNREVVIDYIRESGGADPQLTYNWSILPVETEGRVVFRSSPDGADNMTDFESARINHIGSEDDWGLYEYDLSYEESSSGLFNRIRSFFSNLFN